MKNFDFINSNKKIICSVLIIIIAGFSYFSILDNMVTAYDDDAQAYYNSTLKKALITFAIVRSANGVISLIQESNIAVEPAGVGVNIAVGQLLDPINDLLEKFSYVMLLSAVSLGIQKIFLQIGSQVGFKILLTISMIFLFLSIWLSEYTQVNFIGISLACIFFSCFIRLVIPTVAIITSEIDSFFLSPIHDSTATELKGMNTQLEDFSKKINPDKNQNNNGAEKGLLDKMKDAYTSTKETLAKIANISAAISQIKDSVSGWAMNTIKMITVFILNTVIIPILVLWMLINFIKFLIGYTKKGLIQKEFRQPCLDGA